MPYAIMKTRCALITGRKVGLRHGRTILRKLSDVYREFIMTDATYRHLIYIQCVCPVLLINEMHPDKAYRCAAEWIA